VSLESDLNSIAWRDFIAWAVGEPAMIKNFEADTGMSFAPPSSPIEAMIDEACNLKEHRMHKFIYWATEKHWGLDSAPSKYLASIKRNHLNDPSTDRH